MTVHLKPSPALIPVPPMGGSPVELEPGMFDTWDDMFKAHPDASDYLLLPGDYTHWRVLKLHDVPGGIPGHPKSIRYHNPGVDTFHPVRRLGNEALVVAAHFERPLTAHWYVRGITFRGSEFACNVAQGASNVTFDFCLVEETASNFGIRFRECRDCTVQRCVIRNLVQILDKDSTGVGIGQVPADIRGIRILDNEIYNVGDCIQLTDHDPLDGPDPPVSGTIECLIEGNDLYVDPSMYLGTTNTTNLENAIDLKVGSPAPSSTVIRHNRMWGFRRNSGKRTSAGECIVVHKYSRNVLIDHNFIGDATYAISEGGWPSGDLNAPRNVIVSNNQIYEIRDRAADDAGAVSRHIFNVLYRGNYFSRCDYLDDVMTDSGYRADGPHWSGNVLRDVSHIQRGQPPFTTQYEPADNTEKPPVPLSKYDTYERKRWTGREYAIGARMRPWWLPPWSLLRRPGSPV